MPTNLKRKNAQVFIFVVLSPKSQDIFGDGIASYTPVIFSDESQGKGLALLRILVSDMSSALGDQYLRAIAPQWVTDCVFRVCWADG